jgi:hypothetical protein
MGGSQRKCIGMWTPIVDGVLQPPSMVYEGDNLEDLAKPQVRVPGVWLKLGPEGYQWATHLEPELKVEL